VAAVLDSSDYSDLFQTNFDINFDPAEGTLIVDYQLPAPDDLPTIKSVKFNASTGELKETHISEKERKDLYDDTCYQICLRTMHEIFEADSPKHLKKVVFNGYAEYVDRTSGKMVNAVILSLLVDRDEFMEINLARIDPKACFKGLKGVSASSLIGLAAVPPVMQMNKNDRRFIEAKSVELGSDGATNLASMDWEQFEHLVRQLFEKEFASRGGEVKVTQSSSDGGVDAVAFDPDPISGGKIVIQAKRYTKTVGVAAVRDLYGTTLSEGASKGILVTTADYGPDAYKFASGKPLTLLTGANLLHLLQKHGIRAKIDLRAAREELGLSGSRPL
jgi:restriction system protein